MSVLLSNSALICLVGVSCLKTSGPPSNIKSGVAQIWLTPCTYSDLNTSSLIDLLPNDKGETRQCSQDPKNHAKVADRFPHIHVHFPFEGRE